MKSVLIHLYLFVIIIASGCGINRTVTTGKPCNSIIPNHEALSLPGGLGVYYPGQQIFNGQPQAPIDSVKQKGFVLRRVPGGNYNAQVKKQISANLGAQIANVFKGSGGINNLSTDSISLENINEIIGNTEDIYSQQNDALIIRNVLMADVKIKLGLKNTAKVSIDTVEVIKALSGKLNAKVERERGKNSEFIAKNVVVGVQSIFVKNNSPYSSVNSFKSTDSFTLKPGEEFRTLVLIPRDSLFPQVSEITLDIENTPTNSEEKRVFKANLFGTGGAIKLEEEINIKRRQVFSKIVPASGANSQDKYIVYIFEFRPENGNKYKIIVNRAMKTLIPQKSGLEVLCQ